MKLLRWLLAGVVRLRQMLGWQGLMIAVITLVSFAFGLGMLMQEYQRPHQTRREVLHSVLSSWMRAPDYLGLNLLDYSARWRRSPSDEQLQLVQNSLQLLGEDLEQRDTEFPLISIEGLRISTPDGTTLAQWLPRHASLRERPVDTEEIIIPDPKGKESLRLVVSYKVAREVNDVFLATENYDDRLIEALVGLSGCSLLCFGYMVLYVQELRERVARESAQEATLDLADRTCHELGNVAFVVANERRNLASHIELFERFLSEEREARLIAAQQAGLDRTQIARFDQALQRQYEQRGIAPDFELARSNQIARDVCKQIAVCSDYITLTVQELDGYLKQSLTPEPQAVKLVSLSVTELFSESLALLAPRIEAAEAVVERVEKGNTPIFVEADRRLMVHLLVNLVKNAIEAVSETGRTPEIRLTAEVGGSGTDVVLQIADNGPGIHDSVRGQLFDGNVTTKGAGRGRGLAIVREAVQAQHGSIEVESEQGQGTVFRIRLRRSVAIEAREGARE